MFLSLGVSLFEVFVFPANILAPPVSSHVNFFCSFIKNKECDFVQLIVYVVRRRENGDYAN